MKRQQHWIAYSKLCAMISLLIVAFFLLMWSSAFALSNMENKYDLSSYSEKSDGTPDFVQGDLVKGVAAGDEFRATIQFLTENKAAFRMNDPASELVSVRVDYDDLGMRHLRMQQFHQGVRVIGGEYISHFRADGTMRTLNGNYVADISIDVNPTIPSAQAVQIGQIDLSTSFGAGNPTDAELVIFPWEVEGEELEANYLCWRFFLLSDSPMGRWEYFVDAKSGEVIYKANRIMNANDVGTGVGVMGRTRDHIDTDWTGSTYRMRDYTRQLNNNPHGHDGEMPSGNYIQTNYASTSLPGSIATDTDNYWNDGTSQAAAVDGHYYSAGVYDWMLTTFDRNGYNGSGASMLTSVNYSAEGDNNAYWNGSQIVIWSWSSGWRSLAGCPDVIAHEWGHAVTEYCSGLIYEKEPGALNESFSDMMGAAYEFTSDDPGDWYMGENGQTTGNGFRSMENPHEFGDPDYYGTSDPYWIDVVGCTPSWMNDYCGVHTNSGVGNKWYFLLSDGGTHHDQTVVGIGAQNAIKIAYRANQFYWTSSSDYHDAALGTITAADDLDPTGAWTAQVRNAWIAVGVSVPTPSVAFSYPDGLPTLLSPGSDTTFRVVVTGSMGGTPISGTGDLHYSIDGGAYTAVGMSESPANTYYATLPGIGCGSIIEFYFTADEVSTGTHSDPGNAPTTTYSAFPVTSYAVVFEDNFQTNKGWTVSGDAVDGQWNRGVPIGGGDRGDPPTDFDGSGSCYLTDNVDGNSDVDGGTTTLVSPTIDLSGADAQIHYARWYSNHTGDDPYNDVFVVYISNNNGSSWVTVETVGPTNQASGGWYEHTFTASDVIATTSQVKLRFDASDLGAGSVVEAGVDDVQVIAFECEEAVDSDGDGIYDSSDNCPLVYNPNQGDADGDGIGDSCDVCTDLDDDGFGDAGYPMNTCELDNCPSTYNPSQADADGDGLGDVCDECTDTDGDGFGNPGYSANTCPVDNCPSTYNPNQDDADGDGIGDSCDVCTDRDDDGFGDAGFPANTCDLDNCPDVYNPDQADADGDGLGDVCDECTDTDGDGFGDPGYPANTCAIDNCPSVHNPGQEDSDDDGIGDSCDDCTDLDGDGFGDPGFPASTCELDNCPSVYNADQSDADSDGIGDSCDVCTDIDGDGYGDPGYPVNTCALDNCPTVYNEDQDDSDDDGVGDVCDECPNDPDDVCCNPQFSNDAPAVTSAGSIIVEPGESVAYDATAADPDCDGSDLDITIINVPSWCIAVGTHVSGTAACGDVDTSFSVVASDGDLADTLVVTITVDHSNVAPFIAQESDRLVRNGVLFAFYPAITDPDDVDHTVTYAEYPSWCTVENDSVIGTAPAEYSTQMLTVIVADFCSADTMSFSVVTYTCGDAEGSGDIDIDDAVYLVGYIFTGGPAPIPIESGDTDCSGEIDIDDVVYLISYIFTGGPEPCASCE
ncbi:MAG: M4 family metallopeptidase [candidate division Zixibacteria bacterium]|nr:M4 family metallopeptidase [candidate division Zixibacteria bacterium]MBU1471272.1 M4 family metallopeptidase [candidate division Zixibacteria bacterium]MBU2625785.1 M4 family metallopeptidase [candidate division Zixibacteria bacterium]